VENFLLIFFESLLPLFLRVGGKDDGPFLSFLLFFDEEEERCLPCLPPLFSAPSFFDLFLKYDKALKLGGRCLDEGGGGGP